MKPYCFVALSCPCYSAKPNWNNNRQIRNFASSKKPKHQDRVSVSSYSWSFFHQFHHDNGGSHGDPRPSLKKKQNTHNTETTTVSSFLGDNLSSLDWRFFVSLQGCFDGMFGFQNEFVSGGRWTIGTTTTNEKKKPQKSRQSLSHHGEAEVRP